jgi:divalent metal cation (Fe/Co/Zn/Cd) transporter
VLFILATAVVMEAWDRLKSGGGAFEPTILAFAVLVISIIVDINRVRALRKVADETGSQALAADAIHFTSDLVGSVLVMIGLAAAAAGFKYGDALAAIGVAAFIAIAGWRLGRQTIDTLLDKAPDGLSDRLRHIIAAVPGVAEVVQLRLRPGGTHMFGDVSVVVSRTLPLDRVRQVKSRIISEVRGAVPDLALSVDAIPRALDDETVLERVLLTAAHCRTPVHHVMVQSLKDRLSVSLDMEVDGRLSLGAAHVKASKLEAAIREELGPETEVETHIEPLVVKHLDGEDVPDEQRETVAATLAQAAEHIAGLESVHNIRVRQTEGGLVVNYHCRFESSLPVAAVHQAVDELERKIRGSMPGLARIVGHAEPMRKGDES